MLKDGEIAQVIYEEPCTSGWLCIVNYVLHPCSTILLVARFLSFTPKPGAFHIVNVLLAPVEVWQERIEALLAVFPLFAERLIELRDVIEVRDVDCRRDRHQLIHEEILNDWLLDFVTQHIDQRLCLLRVQLFGLHDEPDCLKVLEQEGDLD